MSYHQIVAHPCDIIQPSTVAAFDVNEVLVSFEERQVTFHRSLVSGGVFIPLNDVIPCAALQIFAPQKNSAIRILSLTASLKTRVPVKTEEILSFALTVQPPPASDWNALTVGASGSPVFPTSVLARTNGDQTLIAPYNVSASSSVAEIRRAITSSHLNNKHCTNHFVLHLASAFVPPEFITLIAPPAAYPRIPVNMQIGLDAGRLQKEYVGFRAQATDRSFKPGFINVPLYRRIRSDTSSHDQFVMTIFGFWIQYFMDVSKEARPNILVDTDGKPYSFHFRKDKDGNDVIPQCDFGSSIGDQTLFNVYVSVPRSVVVDLYVHLLAVACCDATSRFHDTDNGLNVCFRQAGNTAIENAQVTFVLKYEHVTMTSTRPTQEVFSFMDDFSTTTSTADYAW